jgi:hypothetical protein
MRIFAFSTLLLAVFLFSCGDDDDRCEDLTCFNGGTCLDGICECPPGYVGFNCQDLDYCDTLDCLNGGTCDLGVCDCPPFYSGPTCAEFDSCAALNCENGGTCVDGVCDCPPHFMGTNCEEQETPATVSLIGIRVTLFPQLDEDGIPWDPGSLPDLQPQIWKGNNLVYAGADPLINVMPGENATWQLPVPFSFSDFFDVHNVRLFEVDGPDDQREMGKIYFSPYNSNNDFSEILEVSSDSIHIQLQLSYTW